jgi:SAM-dependent methyltransferase
MNGQHETAVPARDFKIAFLDGLLGEFGDRPLRVLDLGCGTAKDWPSILRAHPGVTYTGVEPDARSRETAREILGGLPATVLAGWGEATTTRDGFDLTLSLSVLEHVKYLDRFLGASVAATRPGGAIVHRYDLGHALYPVNSLERCLVALSRLAPWLVPASIFTSHPEPARVAAALTKLGVSDVRVTYAQMFSLKQAMNRLSRIDGADALVSRVLELDAEIAETVRPLMSDAEMARLFPSVAVRGVRHG